MFPEYTYINETKTKIHDGGFVIYQLTDEEIETDPNGTSVNINDTNKDIEQSEKESICMGTSRKHRRYSKNKNNK